MTYSEKLSRYATAILQAAPGRSEGAFRKAADSFEDDLLELDNFPKEYFEFVLTMFSEGSFYSRPGLWNFLLVLGTEKEKLQQQHYEQLANEFLRHYAEYVDEDLCLGVCDFVARNYSETWARSLLERFKGIEETKPAAQRGFADDGLRILQLEAERCKRAAQIGRTRR